MAGLREPQVRGACPGLEGWLKDPTRAAGTPALAPSLFLISENRFPDWRQALRLVQRLPNKEGGFDFPLAADPVVRGLCTFHGSQKGLVAGAPFCLGLAHFITIWSTFPQWSPSPNPQAQQKRGSHRPEAMPPPRVVDPGLEVVLCVAVC